MPDIAFGVIAPPEFIVELGLKSLGPCDGKELMALLTA
jgi:hypothetical protein